jgi:hypothetical protein
MGDVGSMVSQLTKIVHDYLGSETLKTFALTGMRYCKFSHVAPSQKRRSSVARSDWMSLNTQVFALFDKSGTLETPSFQ